MCNASSCGSCRCLEALHLRLRCFICYVLCMYLCIWLWCVYPHHGVSIRIKLSAQHEFPASQLSLRGTCARALQYVHCMYKRCQLSGRTVQQVMCSWSCVVVCWYLSKRELFWGTPWSPSPHMPHRLTSNSVLCASAIAAEWWVATVARKEWATGKPSKNHSGLQH